MRLCQLLQAIHQHEASTIASTSTTAGALDRQSAMRDAYQTNQPAASQVPKLDMEAPRTMLLCGADLLHSFATPGVWKEAHVREIMSADGVICIAR